MNTLNTIGLNCPEPIMLLHKTVRALQQGDVITMVATDPASRRDVVNFCQHLGHKLVSQSQTSSCELPSVGDDDAFEVYYHYKIEVKK